MPRQLGDSVQNFLNVNDPFTGEKIRLHYAAPTTGQRVNYSRELQVVRRKGNKVEVEDNVFKTRVKYAAEILTGFDEAEKDKDTGTLTGGFADETGKPFASDPKSVNYRSDWKEKVRKYAADILEFLARRVFEGVTEAVEIGFGEKETSGDGTTTDPADDQGSTAQD